MFIKQQVAGGLCERRTVSVNAHQHVINRCSLNAQHQFLVVAQPRLLGDFNCARTGPIARRIRRQANNPRPRHLPALKDLRLHHKVEDVYRAALKLTER